MIIVDTLRSALLQLGANKLRTGLTMLGIIIGVGAVIALMAAGQGAQQGVTSDPLCSERCVHTVHLYSNCALIASRLLVRWWRFCIVADQGLTLG